ncbi:MAG: glutamate synthase large subunit [SAR202 cluster bacterium]|jgi:glutamate synthase domain-containing protein 2/glutamate synthase domain-containing protein 1/glutamate synthase domain-containing protein 3|nr:glutamate synthase large subunit [SAR202 cluster bacterium]HJO61109.1 glutamate synthase large subunit [SAR202 cluster bacterium]|tara:strand:+ start:23034 stop:27590 length:4557 start_codon:yes stop_codon:yes gene_type:complete
MKSPYENKKLRKLVKQGLYDPVFEHDACGVGMVANIKGKQSHSIVSQGLEALSHLAHRGAAGADPETGDGAGILIQMPHDFFKLELSSTGCDLPDPGQYGVGMAFLPSDKGEAELSRSLIEECVLKQGYDFLAWRQVPIDPEKIGVLANRDRPHITQFFVTPKGNVPKNIDRDLYLLRRAIESSFDSASLENADDFYICSLSSSTIVYKGLVMAEQLEDFYKDLTDANLVSSFALVHSRFSTNTLGSWKLAHPYRFIIHNGEINTVRGNTNWMLAREQVFESSDPDVNTSDLVPVIKPGQSDTAALDNALELLLATGRSIEHSMMMLIPEAWGDHIPMEQSKKDFYEYHSSMMEAWDGPALVIGTDGTKVCAVLDRNGLRPCRYLVTTDDVLVMASETGVIDVPPEKVLYKERIYPGRMFLLDTKKGELVNDLDLKAGLAGSKPYGEWLSQNRIFLEDLPEAVNATYEKIIDIKKQQNTFGYTLEDFRMILEPMAVNGYEPTGSMGNDAPLAFLSDHNPILFNYFKQLFAQVSNPPLDAIREELVTSLRGTLGEEKNLFAETPDHCRQITLRQPIITDLDLGRIKNSSQKNLTAKTISTLFDPSVTSGFKDALSRINKEASDAIKEGHSILILSDRGVGKSQAPLPSLLATSAVHHHLIRKGERSKAGIVVETGEAREVAHFAALIGYGAAAINPYLAFETIRNQISQKEFENDIDATEAIRNYISACHKGILKIMSKMGISTIQSYRGAQIFEAVGLNQSVIDEYFTWTPSRIGGIGIEEIEREYITRHTSGYGTKRNAANLEVSQGGQYQWRRDGEFHMWNPNTITSLQHAVRENSWDSYEQFADSVDQETRRLSTIRGLLDFKKSDNPISIDEVEPAKEIVRRFATGAISLGSISREAHETMAIAMNRIQARSNTGEGGEDHSRYVLDPNGDSRNSAIKQVASGRFGVTINYLANAKDIQIKMAQGSKPGEGGQLPGHKVDEYIGGVRNSTPGVELISPPPHHDIYSIEDLAQLIHDLKNANPEARIHVKLVAEAGVGTIAAGVSKGHGDVVLISGDTGGTGASPESSIKHAGLPWELGVAETQQVLVMNDLRGRIVVQADGQIKTGRDVAIACLLGAEEFGLATGPLIAMGCIMLRKCHLNTCSVGIATQDPELREKFAGKPEHVINYFFFIAEQLRKIMADLGIKKIEDMVGRTDLLDKRDLIAHWKTEGVDFSQLLHMPDVPEGVAKHKIMEQDHSLEKALDNELIKDATVSIDTGKPITITKEIDNSYRTVGTTLSHTIAKKYGEDGLPENTISLDFSGSGGQSFAAFLSKGVSIDLKGDSNDYFCKGLSGGKVVIRPHEKSTFTPEENIIIGNVALYGATGGQVFIRGIAGERFAVRNSGAEAVVEGVGDHGCEYMTRGKVVILGPTGRNFAAGMSGGEAYVFDEEGKFESLCNKGLVTLEKISEEKDLKDLKRLIELHKKHTGSKNAERIMSDWSSMTRKFVKVMPVDYKRVLAERQARQADKVVSANG